MTHGQNRIKTDEPDFTTSTKQLIQRTPISHRSDFRISWSEKLDSLSRKYY